MQEGDDDHQTPYCNDSQYFNKDELGPKEPPHKPIMLD